MQDALDLAAGLARRFEGLRLAPYRDAAGFPTIGYGHLLSRDPAADLARWPTIDVAEAERLLELDLARAERALRRLSAVPMGAGQRAALIDFIFNVGAGAYQASALRLAVNRADRAEVPAQLMRWIHAGGRPLAGLRKRRQAEAAMFVEGSLDGAGRAA